MKWLATAEAARAVGIDRVTLQRWIRSGKVKPPKPKLRNGRGIRPWSEHDIKRLRRVKAQIYRKGRGRKKKRDKRNGPAA